nr:YcnI family protein [Mycolicibacterium flavescens]
MLFAGTATASAHVHADAENPTPGSSAVVTFRVPGESETGALTTALTVELPDSTSVRTETIPGWTAELDRDTAAGTVRAVTWTAAPGTGISSEQFGLFRITVKLPDTDTVSFPATQTYSDGTVVRWDQPALPDGGEPEFPAPALSLTGTSGGDHHGASSASSETSPEAPSDNSARWLAGGALVLAAAALAVALTSRRRT